MHLHTKCQCQQSLVQTYVEFYLRLFERVNQLQDRSEGKSLGFVEDKVGGGGELVSGDVIRSLYGGYVI